jgi:hypothetical protein
MRASLGSHVGSHDTGDDYQLRYMRCLRIESMRLRRSDTISFDSIVNPCLRHQPSQSVRFAFRIRSNKPPYSVVNRG